MKLITGILSVYLLFLVALPSFKAVAATETTESCCSHCAPDSSKSDDDRDNLPTKSQDSPYSCNPFEICTACIGFTIQMSPSIATPIILSEKKFILHYSEPSSDFTASIFQPPKIG